jgi:Chitin binding Peritrophin-A domain
MWFCLIFLTFFSFGNANYCTSEPDTLAIYPSPNNCSTFIACVNGEESTFECVQAPQFIPGSESSICMTPCIGGSSASKKPSNKETTDLPPDPLLYPDTPSRTIVCPPSGETRAVISQSRCSEFLSCKNGVGTKEACPAGQEFSPSQYECVDKRNSDCSRHKQKGKYSQKCRYDKGGFEPIYFASSVCPEFKKCAVKLAWSVKCARYTHWNNDQKTCEWADKFICSLASS